MRLNDAKRKEEISTLEKERVEDAKRNLNLRYASIPRRSDMYPYPYFREFYGGPNYGHNPAVVHNVHNTHYSHVDSHCGHHHDHCMTPMRCKDCYKQKTTYILPPISGHRDS